ncbi:MAG: Eco57I restriction-modification methylase domain-containing protein, partial [Alphaproteobacteria bacterium]
HFKDKIFENLLKNNPRYDKLTLFKKSQKLLDRFLFVFFAEDSGLIPPNAVSKIVEQWKTLQELDEYKPLYSRFQKLFTHLDKGHVYKKWGEIPAYNGGLFRNDEILDSSNVKIDDEILEKDSLKLSKYDFNTEVDVNILGHIFEHSLNEIEEITAELHGEKIDKKKSKRKKDGVFYTPKYITKYIVENTVGTLCNEKKEELQITNLLIDENYRKKDGKINEKGKKLFKTLNGYKDWLLTLKILDPACGSGAFLNQTLDFLIAEHKQADDLIAELTGENLRLFDTDKSILENNIYGVDINEESVEIAKLSLWLRTAQKGRKLSDLSGNIKCGNSLIDDPEVAGEKAFNWNIEFREIMDNGGFDVIIGNPPYGAELDGKKWLKQTYPETSFGNIDSYKYFVQKGILLLRTQGVISYIMPDSYLEKEYFKDLREFVVNNFAIIKNIKLGDDIFDDVNLPTAIITLLNKSSETSTSYSFLDISKVNRLKKQEELFSFSKFISETPVFLQTFIISNSIISKKNTIKLINAYEQVMGVKVYQKGKGKPKQTAIEKAENVFISKIKNDEFQYPFISQGIYRYYYETKNEFINYGQWLAEPREQRFFDLPKVIIREIVNPRIFSIFVEESSVVKNIAAVIIERTEKYSLKYLLSLINSKLLSYYVEEQSPKSNNKSYPSFNSKLIKNIPIKDINVEAQQPFIEKADLMLSLNKELQKEKENFLNTLKEEKGIERITKKLDAFYDFEYDILKKELAKQKVKLALGNENNKWREYFNTSKQKINNIQNQINQTDKEIDKMVYELYELTNEEIEIVENSVK